jgi:hypothetical protein
MQADYLFDEAREVALAAPKTVWIERLRFDVIRWQTARLAPRKYCERLVVANVEAEPEPPLTIEVRNFRRGPDGQVVEAPSEHSFAFHRVAGRRAPDRLVPGAREGRRG